VLAQEFHGAAGPIAHRGPVAEVLDRRRRQRGAQRLRQSLDLFFLLTLESGLESRGVQALALVVRDEPEEHVEPLIFEGADERAQC
jgi:hypothetical protein